MAYISTEEVKEIRTNLKKEFPSKDGWKLSITKRHHSTVCVNIMESPIDLDPENKGNYEINHYYIDDNYENQPALCNIFNKIKNIILNVKHQENRNAGDIYADYAAFNFFYNISVGKWNENFKIKEEKKAKTTLVKKAVTCTVKTMSDDCFTQIDNYLSRFKDKIIGETIEETKNNIMERDYFLSGCFTYIQASAFAEYYHGLIVR